MEAVWRRPGAGLEGVVADWERAQEEMEGVEIVEMCQERLAKETEDAAPDWERTPGEIADVQMGREMPIDRATDGTAAT